MTNYEKIKNMTLGEMADMLSDDDILIAPCNSKYCKHFRSDGVCSRSKEEECPKATIKWLESEVTDDDQST